MGATPRHQEPELPPPPPPPTLPPENPLDELPPDEPDVDGGLCVLANDEPMLYTSIGLDMYISGGGTLLLASARPHASTPDYAAPCR